MKFDIEKKGYKKSEVDEYVFALKNEYESKLAEQKNRIFQLRNELTEREKQIAAFKSKTDLISTAILNAVQKADEIEKLAAARYRDEMQQLRAFHDKWQAHYNKMLEKYPDQMTGLSEREREVAALAAEGLRNKEIAQRLFISEETVKSHIRSIFNKTNIDRRSKLVDLLK